jgi:predicted RNA binding protein with dsRBD fold (UPF0201 family)
MPNDIDIVVEAQVKYTESRDKVATAIKNLFGTNGELRVEEDRVMFLSSNKDSLQLLKDQFRDRHVRAAARRLLMSGSEESNQAVLLLNKQAATVGIAALCDDPGESPLGPIVLRIRSQNIREVIEWLTKGYDSRSTS